MKQIPQALICLILCAAGLFGVAGCEEQVIGEQKTLKVGIIASLTGPGRAWGEATVRCAQVTADYYNERGGVLVGDERVKIELVIKDDALDSGLAATAAHELVMDDVNFVIGPLGDAAVMAASKVLDGSGVLYVHYGFNQIVQPAQSLGLLGMPLPEQSLPVLFEYLSGEVDVESVLVLAYASEESIRQKTIAEYVASAQGMDLMKLSRFDVSEESFDLGLSRERISQRIRRVVEAAPDAVVLVGCPPDVFVFLVDRLRSGGYDGVISAQNYQDATVLRRLGEVADGVYYVGGIPGEEVRSAYFEDLKTRYLDLVEVWSEEAETKMYALEFMLECIRQAGIKSLEETSSLFGVLDRIEMRDPFYEDGRPLLIHRGGAGEGAGQRQIMLPIRISKMQAGEPRLVVKKSVGAKQL